MHRWTKPSPKQSSRDANICAQVLPNSWVLRPGNHDRYPRRGDGRNYQQEGFTRAGVGEIRRDRGKIPGGSNRFEGREHRLGPLHHGVDDAWRVAWVHDSTHGRGPPGGTCHASAAAIDRGQIPGRRVAGAFVAVRSPWRERLQEISSIRNVL